MSEIKHIVFDIGQVLLHYDPEIPFRRLIPDETERAWFFSNVCTHEWNLEQDRGRSWSDAEAELVANYPDHEANIRGFRAHWGEMVPYAYENSVAVLEAVHNTGMDLTLLTNFAADTLEEARGRFAFLGLARGATVSAEIGYLKPEPEIYEHHVKTFGLAPEAILFFDDNAANVEGARQMGWNAVHFTGQGALEAGLEAHNVKL